MLLGVRVANVLSFREEQRLAFVATDLNDGSARPTGVREHGKEILVVPVLGLYGANASGKTNLLAALRLMRVAVLESLRWFSDPKTVRRIAFALDPESALEPSFYEVDLVLTDGVRYTYGFEIDDDRVRGEWLHAYPKGRKQVWFDRVDDKVGFPGEGLRGEKLELARRTRPDALFLSIAAQFNHEQLMPIFAWFRDNLWLVSPEQPDRVQRLNHARKKVVRDATFREQIARLLKVADLGISGIEVVSETDEQIRLIHQAGSREVPLDFARESMGTRSWFALLGAVLDAFAAGTTILVDELDASLHPTMSAEVIRMFQDPDANPHGAQMLFTTHDATLLHTLLGEDRVLDRDTVWLTEKDAEGATELYPLTGFQPPPRKEDNLFRKYLLGKYGGTPRVSSGELAREVEVISR
jgi:ABC-type dipeptide/oligopeptide/nickel transport system ATPase subunit